MLVLGAGADADIGIILAGPRKDGNSSVKCSRLAHPIVELKISILNPMIFTRSDHANDFKIDFFSSNVKCDK